MQVFANCLSNNTNHTKNIFGSKRNKEKNFFHAYFQLSSPYCVDDIDINYDEYGIIAFEYEPIAQFRDFLNPYTCVDTAVPLPDGFDNNNVPNACNCDYYWHLDAIDGDFWNEPDGEYNHIQLNDSNDANVDIYIVDGGVLSTHVEFNHRNFVRLVSDDETFNDNNITSQHATFVAGMAGGNTAGVARNYGTLYDVPRCLGASSCSSQDLDIGFELIVDELESFYVSPINRRRAVIVMSWGWSFSQAQFDAHNQIFEEITQLGGIFFAATTNQYIEWNEPCDESPGGDGPAGCQNVVTVARSNIFQNTTVASGYGECIDIYGPGQSVISSTWLSSGSCTQDPTGNGCYRQGSGTSYATPAIAGLVANMLAVDDSLEFDQILAILKDSDGSVPLYDCRNRLVCLFFVFYFFLFLSFFTFLFFVVCILVFGFFACGF